jgi:hypothetical protein
MLVDGGENSRQKTEESKENFVYVGALDMMMMMMMVIMTMMMLMMMMMEVFICLSSSS